MYRVIAKLVTITVYNKDATKRPYPPKQQGHCASSSAMVGQQSVLVLLAVESAKQTACPRRRQSPVGRID